MPDMEAMRVIEALRSGVPSRAIGKYFSEARPKMIQIVTDDIDSVAETGKSKGFIYSGKYGEGKTHLLNTAMTIAQNDNMVVSYMAISKEAPFDKIHQIYRNVIHNTYLPRHEQPGFLNALWEIGASSPVASEMLLYAAKELETDKLFFLLKSFLSSDDQEEKFRLLADLEGDFISNAELKKIYRRITGTPAKYNVTFSKTKHSMDYFAFMSRLFTALGYNGWVILVDEVELTGRLGKKARQNSYRNMYRFLHPDDSLHATYTMFAVSSMYESDVIEDKHEYDNLEQFFPMDQVPGKTVLQDIENAKQLNPLTREEINSVVARIMEFHSKAYSWEPNVDLETVVHASESSGVLLRTKLRSAIEFLDQKYQYGDGGHAIIGSLSQEDLSEEMEDVPALDED